MYWGGKEGEQSTVERGVGEKRSGKAVLVYMDKEGNGVGK